MGTTGVVRQDESRTRLAVALAVAAVITMAVLAVLDHDGPAWLLQPLFGGAAAVLGWRAGGSSPKRNAGGFVALAIGTLMVLIFLAYVVSGS